MEGSDTTSSSPPPSPATPPSRSLASELFGSRESPSSSAGIFASIFAPPPKVFGRESLRTFSIVDTPENPPVDVSDDSKIQNPEESESMPSKEQYSIYEDQRVQPCHLSSSIFYGGQDIYSHPRSNVGSVSGLTPPAKKEGIEDDSGIASRGNWWQGSLYY